MSPEEFRKLTPSQQAAEYARMAAEYQSRPKTQAQKDWGLSIRKSGPSANQTDRSEGSVNQGSANPRIAQPQGNERPANIMLARADQRAQGKYTYQPLEATGDGQARAQVSLVPSLLNSSGVLKVEIANGVLSVAAGSGLANSGTSTAVVLDVNVDASTIEINSDTLRVKDLGITAAKLASDAVTTAKILDANVTTAKLAALNAMTDADVGLTDEFPVYSASAAANRNLTVERVLGYALPSICDGRLTLTTVTPVTTSDVIGATTVYFTPYNGSRIALYDGTRWKLYTFTERSLALGTITSGKNYDVFIYDNSGTLTLELSAAWTSDTARSDALTTQDGVYVKSGSTTRRYLGTFRTTSTTTTEDSKSKRFVWNVKNRVSRNVSVVEGTNSWTGTTSAWRGANNSSSNRFEFVRGLDEDNVTANVMITGTSDATGQVAVGIGLDSTTVNSAIIFGDFWVAGQFHQTGAFYNGAPGLGYHYLQWLEYYGAAGNITWYGDNGSAFWQGGMVGQVFS
jgi:hypothetical protein